MGLVRNLIHGGDTKPARRSSRDGTTAEAPVNQARRRSADGTHEGHHDATPAEVAKALELVTSAVHDLEQALSDLNKKGGLAGAVKTGVAATKDEATWSDVGTTAIHDGRIPAKSLSQSAHDKYEEAAELVDGLPEIDVPNIKSSKVRDKAESKAGVFGATAATIAGASAGIVCSAAAGVPGVGAAIRAAKKRRTKKAVTGVDGMLAEYEQVRKQLEALNRRGTGGCL